LVGGRAVGDVGLSIRGIATLAHAGAAELGLLADRRYLDVLSVTKAGALLISEELNAEVFDAQVPDAEVPDVPNRLVVENPREAMALLIDHFHPEPPRRPGIHSTAVIGEGVRLGLDVCLGPYVVIEDDVVIGDRATLHAHVVVRQGARIGDDSVLHPHVVLYPLVLVGHRVVLHSGVRVGVDGFGYTPSDGETKKIPHVGLCVIGDDVEIGANSCIDRGSIGRTELGHETKLDNLVHIGHNVTIGPGSFLAGQVGIAGSTRIGAGTMWGGQSGAADHVDVGDGVKVAGQAGVADDVPAGETVAGFPARPIKDFHRATAAMYRLADLRQRVRRMERALQLGRSEEATE
jgi:UDP-3-O-[3-hydroxymyristoyl] glucosamine N-acyltransferase